ncbi:MAG TPA: hypothetical protein VNR59_05095 [Gaiellaceae bacterium]|nr:hypothetical protein [Gaiellaceae bacterium]
MRWEQRGQLLPAPLPVEWATSHAALPHASPLADDLVRVYLSARDQAGRSHIGYADFDPAEPTPAIAASPRPILDPGRLGAFDDSGVTTSCLVQHGDAHYLYYTGWSLGQTVPFYLYVGLAISDDGERFERVSAAPILERSNVDPFLTASPWVLVDEGRWRMWYVSATQWEIAGGEARHSYHVRYAESDDGITWRRDGTVCIDFQDEDEYAISRPCVVRDGELYRMWFSARGPSYRIGYAESQDGITWQRKDEEAGIESTGDWDAEMQAYPSVFDHEGRRYLLYNGNGYGRAGIGWAAAIASL